MARDISEIRPVERDLEIVIPGTIWKIGLTLTVMSLQDDRMVSVRRKAGDKFLARRQRNKTQTAAEIEHNQRELCIAATTGWKWGPNNDGEQATFKGDQPDFSHKALSEVLLAMPWIVPQIDEFVSDEAGFFQT